MSGGERGAEIIIDTREQTPLTFPTLPSCRGTLYTGDYSIPGFEEHFAIERKSLDDLAGSLGQGRDRFARELHRLRGFDFARLLVVGTRKQIEAHDYRSRMAPASVLGSLDAFEVRYRVPVVFCPTPKVAARQVERWACYFHRECRNRVGAAKC